jgi:hypothetical protein
MVRAIANLARVNVGLVMAPDSVPSARVPRSSSMEVAWKLVLMGGIKRKTFARDATLFVRHALVRVIKTVSLATPAGHTRMVPATLVLKVSTMTFMPQRNVKNVTRIASK